MAPRTFNPTIKSTKKKLNKKKIHTSRVKKASPKENADPVITELTLSNKESGLVKSYDTGILLKKFRSVPAMLREIGSMNDSRTNQQKIYAVLWKAYDDAMAGDHSARDFIVDRLEGKAVQRQMVQNIDVINKIVQALERVISDPLPKSADLLMIQIVYELEKIARMEEEGLAL